MKILIITQVLDINHPILGFFHRWVEEFATQCTEVHVIALQVGEYHLPANVFVHSLGKEHGQSRIKYLWRFYSLIWKYRKEYDSVFVHMNQMYVILGTPIWRLLRKKIGLWYAHGTVSRSLKIAVALADTVFTSTPQGLQIDTPKRVIVGQGIDMELFSYKERTSNQIPRFIVDGRIAPSKNIDVLLRACALVRDSGQKFTFTIVGAPITAEEHAYAKELKALVQELQLTECVHWYGGVNQAQLVPLLHESDIYIHDGATQSLDKVLVQAVSTGLPTLSSNTAFAVIVDLNNLDLLFSAHNSQMLSERIKAILTLSDKQRWKLMYLLSQNFRTNYSIDRLVSGIVVQYE